MMFDVTSVYIYVRLIVIFFMVYAFSTNQKTVSPSLLNNPVFFLRHKPILYYRSVAFQYDNVIHFNQSNRKYITNTAHYWNYDTRSTITHLQPFYSRRTPAFLRRHLCTYHWLQLFTPFSMARTRTHVARREKVPRKEGVHKSDLSFHPFRVRAIVHVCTLLYTT